SLLGLVHDVARRQRREGREPVRRVGRPRLQRGEGQGPRASPEGDDPPPPRVPPRAADLPLPGPRRSAHGRARTGREGPAGVIGGGGGPPSAPPPPHPFSPPPSAAAPRRAARRGD